MFSTHLSVQFGKALPVQVSHNFLATSAVFDDEHLVSCAGLVPVMTLATRTGCQSAGRQDPHPGTRIKSGAANPAPKLAHVDRGHVRRGRLHR